VRAFDGQGLYGDLAIHISVIDVNDMVPEFDLTRYSARIKENITVGESVGDSLWEKRDCDFIIFLSGFGPLTNTPEQDVHLPMDGTESSRGTECVHTSVGRAPSTSGVLCSSEIFRYARGAMHFVFNRKFVKTRVQSRLAGSCKVQY